MVSEYEHKSPLLLEAGRGFLSACCIDLLRMAREKLILTSPSGPLSYKERGADGFREYETLTLELSEDTRSTKLVYAGLMLDEELLGKTNVCSLGFVARG